jgi:TolB-like protein/Tfp pilus assembly protein PilF
MRSSSERKVPTKGRDKSFFRRFLIKLRKRKILETLGAFVGGGWILYEIVHWVLVEHYHFSESLIDITIVSLLGALLCTLAWRWFSGRERTRKFRLELVLIPFIFLVATVLDIRLALHLKRPGTEAVPASYWKNSIAVLPFLDLSPGKDQEYFCDGMTEELIDRLSNIKELKVPARTSVFTFKGRAEDIREIGRKLDVRNVLEGSIRKEGNQLRITVQLVNASDSFHIWSETFDKELTRVFDVQDEIALTIADKLKFTLLGDEKARLLKRPAGNLEAYDLYLLARYFFYKGTEENINKAIKYSEQAIAKDPKFALAYMWEGYCFSVLCGMGYRSPKEIYQQAKEAAEKALELDEECGEAHASLGYIKICFDWDRAGAEPEFKRALSLCPDSVDVLILYSLFMTVTERLDEAIAGFKHAVELDPATPVTYTYLGGFGYYMAGRFDEAIAQIKKALDIDPNFILAELFLAAIYASKGTYEKAIAQADKLITDLPTSEDAEFLTFMGWVYAVSGRQEDSRKYLNRMLDLRAKRYVDAYLIGEVYAGLGEKDNAFKWLAKSYEEHSGQIFMIRIDNWLNNLRSDPRFKQLLKKMKFDG